MVVFMSCVFLYSIVFLTGWGAGPTLNLPPFSAGTVHGRVYRETLWKILRNDGVPKRLMNIGEDGASWRTEQDDESALV